MIDQDASFAAFHALHDVIYILKVVIAQHDGRHRLSRSWLAALQTATLEALTARAFGCSKNPVRMSFSISWDRNTPVIRWSRRHL